MVLSHSLPSPNLLRPRSLVRQNPPFARSRVRQEQEEGQIQETKSRRFGNRQRTSGGEEGRGFRVERVDESEEGGESSVVVQDALQRCVAEGAGEGYYEGTGAYDGGL